MKTPRLIKFLLVLIVGLLVASAAYFVYTQVRHSQEAKINIFVLPEDATVTVDSQVVKKKSFYVKPGAHVVEASKTGFKSDRRTISVNKKDVLDLYLLPNPESQEALNWLAQNPEIQRLREEYAAHNVAQLQSILQQKYPIIKELPIITPYYRIDYGVSEKKPDDPESLALYITVATEANKNFALQRIRDEGFDPSQLEIIYKTP
ncbi:MAG TPA: hypothetical protein VI336_04150 [Candidatus Saccharimonadales bacterium]|nr:hypothetical protein [Candidatus Saccharimonadales bacterium]